MSRWASLISDRMKQEQREHEENKGVEQYKNQENEKRKLYFEKLPPWLKQPAIDISHPIYEQPARERRSPCFGVLQRTEQIRRKSTWHEEEQRRLKYNCTNEVQYKTLQKGELVNDLVEWLLQDTSPTAYVSEQGKHGLSLPAIGASLCYHRDTNSFRYGQVSDIILSSLTRSICINFSQLYINDRLYYVSTLEYCWKLHLLLQSEQVNLGGFHAGLIAWRLRRFGLRCRIRDLSTACGDYDDRNLLPLASKSLKGTSLMNKLNPYFGQPCSPSSDVFAALREAYFCATLTSQVLSKAIRVSTMHRPDFNAKLSFAFQDSIAGRLLPMPSLPQFWSISFSSQLSKRLQPIASEDDPNIIFPGYFILHCDEDQDVPEPSRYDIVEFRLAYKYYGEKDNAPGYKKGVPTSDNVESQPGYNGPVDGLWSEMYGQIFRISGRDAHIHFPSGLQAHPNYTIIPKEVFELVKLDQDSPGNLKVEKVLQNNYNKRISIVGVNLITQSAPSEDDMRIHETLFKLLAE